MATISFPAATSAPHRLWAGRVVLMHSEPHDAVENMALDEAMLLTAAESGETLVRLYSWARPTVSFGRNQRCLGVYASERCDALGVPAVRRLTGGRALLHAREVTYAVAAPTSAASTMRGGYEAINDVLLAALQSIGVDARRAAPTARTPTPGLAPCFESPSAGELVVGTQKLVGSAQHRGDRAFLQHGSILLDDDQSQLRALSLVPLPDVPSPATLRGCRPDAGAAMLIAALDAALRAVVTGDIVETSESALPAQHVAAAETRYRDPRWTWRR